MRVLDKGKAYDEFINRITNIECNMLYGNYLYS